MAAARLAVADAEQLEQFHYCGLSVGGITGQYLGVHHADRLVSLTLCNTAAKIGAPELWNERIGIARSQGRVRWPMVSLLGGSPPTSPCATPTDTHWPGRPCWQRIPTVTPA